MDDYAFHDPKILVGCFPFIKKRRPIFITLFRSRLAAILTWTSDLFSSSNSRYRWNYSHRCLVFVAFDFQKIPSASTIFNEIAHKLSKLESSCNKNILLQHFHQLMHLSINTLIIQPYLLCNAFCIVFRVGTKPIS